MFRGFWFWLRRMFFLKTSPSTGGRRSARLPSRLGIEFLEDRAVPATSVTGTP